MIDLRLKKITLILILAFSLIFMSSCSRSGEGIVISGSTSVQPYAEMLEEEYVALHRKYPEKYPEIVIDVLGSGSSAGIQAAESGTANIGMSSRALKEAEQELWSVEIAKDGLAVIIHDDNNVQNLTLEQIRDIYTGEIKNWGELGGRDAKIHVITREEGSGTRSAFEDLVMDKNRITSKAIVQDSNGAVRLLVSDDVNAIGFISLGLVDPEKGQKLVKALQLDGVEATAENIMNGSYKLFRPFLFVTLGEPDGLTKQFIDFVLSPEGQQVLINEGLISHMNITE
jgi:phosphate transport system substrate-binding protein